MLSILFQKFFFLVASYSVMKYFDINLFWYIILNFFGVPHTHTHTQDSSLCACDNSFLFWV